MIYFIIWCNSNAFSLLKCKLYKERGITDNWNSRPKIATEEKVILQSSKRSMDFWRFVLEFMKNYGAKRGQRGPTRQPQGLVTCPTPLGTPPASVGPWWLSSRCPLAIKILFALEKITKKYQDFPPPSARRNLGGALLLSGGAILPGKLPFGRGKSKPSSSPTLQSSWRSSSSSTSSPAPSHLQTLVHLLCSIFVSNLRLVLGVLVALITPCS